MIDPRVELLAGIQSRTSWVDAGPGPKDGGSSYYKELRALCSKADAAEAVKQAERLLKERGFDYDAPLGFVLSLDDGWKFAAPRAGWEDGLARRAGGEAGLEELRSAYAAAAKGLDFAGFYRSHRGDYDGWISAAAKGFGRGKLAAALALLPIGRVRLHIVLSPAMFRCGYGADAKREDGRRDCYVVLCNTQQGGGAPDFGDPDDLSAFCLQVYAMSLAKDSLPPERIEAAAGFRALYALAASVDPEDAGSSPAEYLCKLVGNAIFLDVAQRAGILGGDAAAREIRRLHENGLFPIEEALRAIGEAGKGGRRVSAAAMAARVLDRLDGESVELIAKARSDGSLPLTEPELRAAVARDASTFPAGALPAPFLEAISGKNLVFLGEAHYRLEHQLFLCSLFPALHSMGFRTIANELPSADEPMADAYARGEIDELPGSIRMFDGIWLDALRAFNARLPRGERIRVRYFDMNHDATAYGEALDFVIGRSASEELLREMARDVLTASPSFTSSYRSALEGFKASLEAPLPQGLDPRLATELAGMTETELRSAEVRAKWSDAARESIIIDRCSAMLAEAPGGKLFVNTGAYHAQRTMIQFVGGDGTETVASWFQSRPYLYGGADRLYSVKFDALKGEMLQHYYDRSTISFNYYDNHSCGLFKAMGDLSGGKKACFLPLASPEFSRALDELGEGRGRTSLHPAYDALVVYPRATVIPSLAPRG